MVHPDRTERTGGGEGDSTWAGITLFYALVYFTWRWNMLTYLMWADI